MTVDNEEKKQQEPPYLFLRETEFFEFTPLSFVDTIVNLLNQHMHHGLDELEELLEQQKPKDEEEAYAFEKGMQQAASLLDSTVDKNMDRWELFCLKEIFTIPYALPSVSDMPFGQQQEELKVDFELALWKQLLDLSKKEKQLVYQKQILQKRIENIKLYQKEIEVLNREIQVKEGMREKWTFLKQQIEKMNHEKQKVGPLSEKLRLLLGMMKKKTCLENESTFEEEQVYQELNQRGKLQIPF